ncbi:uncharacterized protein LOC134274629, partial [Saccostrea cucullata]|uniref:uncharacterized protein LOC134274629 n=1 Tax=Saccostrea cuccullata TaxID=36930 RepID=UPI002ED674B6
GFCSSYDQEFCKDSQVTETPVSSCPTTKVLWERRAHEKNCSSFPHNCLHELLYHCLINPWQNSTIEVCAQKAKISADYCAEYNNKGGRIQEFYRPTCSSCTKTYWSTEAYHYAECYTAALETSTISFDNRYSGYAVKNASSNGMNVNKNSYLWLHFGLYVIIKL